MPGPYDPPDHMSGAGLPGPYDPPDHMSGAGLPGPHVSPARGPPPVSILRTGGRASRRACAVRSGARRARSSRLRPRLMPTKYRVSLSLACSMAHLKVRLLLRRPQVFLVSQTRVVTPTRFRIQIPHNPLLPGHGLWVSRHFYSLGVGSLCERS